MKIAFVTNICAHYRVRTFELLARSYDVEFFFFSRGEEWYWSRGLGVRAGDFRHEYLPGFHVGRTRITPGLVPRLLAKPYDLFIKCINGRFALPATYWVARRRRRPFILWTGLWSDPGGMAHRLARPITHGLYRHADAVVTYGEHVRSFLKGLGVDPRRIFVAPHAVDNEMYRKPVPAGDRAALRRHLDLPEHGRVVLYVGRLERSKGLEYLLDAFRLLPRSDAHLVLLGTGSESERLRRIAARSCGARVRFAGQVRPEETVPYLALAETVVLPSITTPAGREPWGLVINEAFNQGVPVVVTEAVGAAAAGFVRDGRNGFIVPERDGPALADRISLLLAEDRLRTRLGQTARETVAAWDNERMIAGFRSAIDFATAEHPAVRSSRSEAALGASSSR